MRGRRVLAKRYELLDKVGSGGTGTVYRARDLRKRQTVAVKLLHASLTSDAAYAKRFRKEAAFAKSVNSPKIARVLNYDSDDGTPFIVMEFVEGITLKQLIDERGPLDPGFALSVMVQVAEALHAVHAKGVIHRDIKPSNIKVLADGSVKVFDFGIAKNEDATKTRVGEILGSLLYLAPEQLSGGETDARSDIFSLGVVAYQMLAGRVPFEADNFMALMRMHAETTPPPLTDLVPGTPAVLSALVGRCLQREPADRFQSAEELLAAAKEAIGTDGIAPPPRDYVAVAKRRRRIRKLVAGFRRRRRPLALAIATLSAGLGVVAFVMANCVGAGGPSSSVLGKSTPNLSDVVLAKSDVDLEYSSLERADWESGAISNDDFVLSEFCGHEEGREYVAQSERLTGYRARFVQPPNNIMYGIGPASILSTVELFEDPGRARRALALRFLKFHSEIGYPDCWGNKIFRVIEFDDVDFPVGDESWRAVVPVINEATGVESVWTIVAFSRGRLLGTVAIQELGNIELDQREDRRQGDAVRLARSQDRRILAALGGPDANVQNDIGTNGTTPASDTPQRELSNVATTAPDGQQQPPAGAVTPQPGVPPLPTATRRPTPLPSPSPPLDFAISLHSEDGDFIGEGEQDIPFTPSDTDIRTAWFDGHHLYLELESANVRGVWYIHLEAPWNQSLVSPSSYSGATMFPINGPSEPGLSVTGDHRGCGQGVTGNFAVSSLQYDQNNFIEAFGATFVQYCDGAPAALRGEISLRYLQASCPTNHGQFDCDR